MTRTTLRPNRSGLRGWALARRIIGELLLGTVFGLAAAFLAVITVGPVAHGLGV